MTSHSKALNKKLKVKHEESMGFDRKWKIWQRHQENKPSEKVVNLKGYDRAKRRKENSRQINPENIPF